MDSRVLVAIALSLVGGLSTSLGALFVILSRAPNLKMLGLLQGFAAGLMLSISFFDLAHNALNSIGFLKANIWFYAGVILFALVAYFIPEPKLVPSTEVKRKERDDDGTGKDPMKKHRRQVLYSGIITAIGISLHNFPEGMAVFLGSVKGLRVCLNLALAIALHNIPEGVAVALPIYFATESKWQAFKLATLSGFAEPLGVIIVVLDLNSGYHAAYLFPSSLSPEILDGLLGSVGGVMAFLTLHEMLPLAFDYAGQKQAVKAVFIGMAFMSASLYFLEISLPKEMSF
ncbi:zinc transporter ZTP29-like protein [Cinnamomum micranthum f. kanehirae]|uniref:Zinc transporter ZTP29-like protein n=1 Tax=Cinnamomum micranthum f. kanehirae TaxID=337451 RepID=A0A3S3MHG1_9MAGN|nr:zinc transporter ZTP29-like protein [Cinnamomum micranthum f. kanehirae]